MRIYEWLREAEKRYPMESHIFGFKKNHFRIIVNVTLLTPGHIVNRLKNDCPWSGDDFKKI